MSKARQNLERRYWAAPNVKEAHALWLRMSAAVRERVGPAPFTVDPPNSVTPGDAPKEGG